MCGRRNQPASGVDAFSSSMFHLQRQTLSHSLATNAFSRTNFVARPGHEDLMTTDMPVWYIIEIRACSTGFHDDESSGD
jgi:hypothetical protein